MTFQISNFKLQTSNFGPAVACLIVWQSIALTAAEVRITAQNPLPLARSSQTIELDCISLTAPSPPIAQEAVVKVVGCIVRDVRRNAGDQVPRQLGGLRKRSGNTKLVTRKEPADVDLVVGGNLQLKVTIA